MYIQKSKAQKLDTIKTYNLIRQIFSVKKFYSEETEIEKKNIAII